MQASYVTILMAKLLHENVFVYQWPWDISLQFIWSKFQFDISSVITVGHDCCFTPKYKWYTKNHEIKMWFTLVLDKVDFCIPDGNNYQR